MAAVKWSTYYTEQFSVLKSLDLGAEIGDPNYTPGVDFLSMIFYNLDKIH